MTVISPVREAEAALPDQETFGRLVAPAGARHRSIKQLYSALEACRPGGDIASRAAAVEGLVAFVRSKRGAAPIDGGLPGESPQTQRLRLLIRGLELVPMLRQRVVLTLSRLMEESTSSGLFGRLGLPTDRGFFAETMDRISRRFLPEPR